MASAQPFHLKRRSIIFVMGIHVLSGPANSAWLAHELAPSQRLLNRKMGSALLRVSHLPCVLPRRLGMRDALAA